MTDAELASASRPILDGHYAMEVAAALDLHDSRANGARSTTDLAHAARAPSRGAVELLWVDIDAGRPGIMDDDLKLTTADASSADSYDLMDEIASRALLSSAKVIGVRSSDLPAGAPPAAVLP